MKTNKLDSWLNPQGKIIQIGEFNHNGYAHDILKGEMGGSEKLYEYMKKNNIDCSYSILHKRGWVRIKHNNAYPPKIQILGDCIDLEKPMRNTMEPAMNKIQMKVAKELCEEYNVSLHIAINDRRFW